VSISTLVAAGTALVTVRQASGEQRLTRDGQVTDRYTAAVANLGDKSEEVRIGGLYALQRIAQDSPRDAPTIVQVVSAYVRSHAPLPKMGTKGPARPANDVAAALGILGHPLAKNAFVDLHLTNLDGADLTRADLTGANLYGASLVHANLERANLTGAGMEASDLSYALLRATNLDGADLTRADLSRADLRAANLTHAQLSGANLDETYGYSPPSPN
jgi:hypothetical protein